MIVKVKVSKKQRSKMALPVGKCAKGKEDAMHGNKLEIFVNFFRIYEVDIISLK